MTRWILVLALIGCADAARPRGVVLVIGDGMGPGQVGLLLQARPDGAYAKMLREGHVGIVDPTPYGALVADSAAGGTALATGVQTRPRMIAVDPDGRPVETLIEGARRRGWATGVVTTADLTDATPAAFLAHRLERSEQAAIASQEMAAPPSVAIGGGAEWLAGAPSQIRTLGRGDLPYRGQRPSLAELTRQALAVVDRDGFVLVVEAALIDNAAHAHRAPEMLGELEDLDDALAVLRARTDLLVVVTADHETGGFGLQFREAREAEMASVRLASGATWNPMANFGSAADLAALRRGESTGAVTWATEHHTAAPVPLVATGPGAEAFAGFHAQWEIGQRLRAAVGL